MNEHRNAPTARLVRLGDSAYITVVMDGETLTLRQSDSAESFDKALEALKNEEWDALYEAMRPVKSYVTKVDGVELTDEGVVFNGKLIHNAVANRIMDFALAGLPHAPLCKFLTKLLKNPSKRAVDELYTFLEHKNLPITDNGNFLAYKGLKNDYYSVSSGKVTLLKGSEAHGRIFNGIGEEIEIPRNEVCDDKEIGCSYGLHAGTMEYAVGFANGKVVVVEIDPTDVVSIPSDCDCQKLRTCRYKVVDEYTGPLLNPLYESRFTDDDWPEEDEEDADYEEYDPIEITVVSSWVCSIRWEPYNDGTDLGTLTIEKHDGDEILHADVPCGEVVDWEYDIGQRGGSAGRYYNRNIRGQYPTV